MIQLQIKKPIKSDKNPTNTYRFKLEAEHGDYDKVEKVKIDVKQDNPFLNLFLEDLCQKNSIPQHEIETSNFARWTDIDENAANPSIIKKVKKNFIIVWWPRDVVYGDGFCAFGGFTVSYFNEHGVEHEVIVIK